MPNLSLRVIRDEHASLAALLRSLLALVDQGPGDAPLRYFDIMRAMLFYIDEYPEKLHHPKESNLLFPRLVRLRPELLPLVRNLEQDHLSGEGRVRELQHLLLAWEQTGDHRREPFVRAMHQYAAFYLEHMRTEERELLPVAQQVLTADDWRVLDAAFGAHRDPLAGHQGADLDKLFTRIVMSAPAPVGLGPALASHASQKGAGEAGARAQ